jgi:transcriptional regulator with XRE-family HTH domain
MNNTDAKRNQSVANVLKRLREKANLTTRQAAGLIGVTHTTISQFENGKRDFANYRLEQLLKGYGYTMAEFNKILGHKTIISYKDDCLAMINRLDDNQLAAISVVMTQFLSHRPIQNLTDCEVQTSQDTSN